MTTDTKPKASRRGLIDLSSVIGARTKALRETRSFTPSRLSKASAVPTERVVAIEEGSAGEVTLAELAALAKGLGVHPAMLLDQGGEVRVKMAREDRVERIISTFKETGDFDKTGAILGLTGNSVRMAIRANAPELLQARG